MHDVGIAFLRDEVFRRFRFAAGIDRRARRTYRFRLEDGVLRTIILSRVAEVLLRPGAVHHVEPFRSSPIAIIVALEVDAVHLGFLLPPRRNHIECETAIADSVDIRSLLGKKRRQMKRRTHGHHQFQPLRDSRRERRGSRPCIEAGRIDSLDVVQVQFRDQRKVESYLFAALRELARVVPRGSHLLVFHIAQPAAETPASSTHSEFLAYEPRRTSSCR